ncbi:MAG: hypothetical protein JKY54_04560 [Flavobacteriales bacterium]|nr:hypothetical protein [Flavobacteriales bacterium]
MLFLTLYPRILVLQVFCIYHAIKSKADQKWFYLIIFLPVIGSIIYLYTNFYNRQNMDSIKKGVKTVVQSNFKTQQLEKEHRINNSFLNTVNLADAYLLNEQTTQAIETYLDCLTRFTISQSEIHRKLVAAYVQNEDYVKAIEHGDKIKEDKAFKTSNERVDWAWAYYYLDQNSEAQVIFEALDRPYANYHQRKNYCEFLMYTDRVDQAKELHQELLQEIRDMSSYEKNNLRDQIRAIKSLIIKQPN